MVENINMQEVVDCVPSTVTSERNACLLLPVKELEVKNALFQMHLDKSPGPDRMTPVFYQSFW